MKSSYRRIQHTSVVVVASVTVVLLVSVSTSVSVLTVVVSKAVVVLVVLLVGAVVTAFVTVCATGFRHEHAFETCAARIGGRYFGGLIVGQSCSSAGCARRLCLTGVGASAATVVVVVVASVRMVVSVAVVSVVVVLFPYISSDSIKLQRKNRGRTLTL
jgi:hypothetical protein